MTSQIAQPTPPANEKTTPETPQSPKHAYLKLIVHLKLYRQLSTLLLKTDTLLLRLSTILSNPAHTDALLCTLSYTLELLSALLSRMLARKLPSLTPTATTSPSTNQPNPKKAAGLHSPGWTKRAEEISKGSKALAALISDFRIFVRLWALIDIYTWARSLWHSPLPPPAQPPSSKCPPIPHHHQHQRQKEKLLQRIAWAQITACTAFQLLENGAYLSSKSVLTGQGWTGDSGKRREGRWWVWSSRFWFAHVVLEGVRLGTVYAYGGSSVLASALDSEVGVAGFDGDDDDEEGGGGGGEKEDKMEREERSRDEEREKELWWRDVISNLAYLPMTIHWSTETGFL
ncbi:hypothetical protein P154DRAFT_522975, partial [Amniculicola lignicola CBS 123094]